MLVALLARPAGARIPYDERPAYQRAAFTVGALVLDVTPVVSVLVAPQCLPGYVLCKVGFALLTPPRRSCTCSCRASGTWRRRGPSSIGAGRATGISPDVTSPATTSRSRTPTRRPPCIVGPIRVSNRPPSEPGRLLLHLDGDALDRERLARAAALRACGFQGLQRVHAVDHRAEDRVLAVEPRGRD